MTLIHCSDSDLFKKRTLTPETMETVTKALQCDAVARRILAKGVHLVPNQLVGIRINLNVLRHTNVAVHSVHKATSKDGHTRNQGFYRGAVLSYQPVVVLRNAYFTVHQAARNAIAAGTAAKSPMASIDGNLVPTPDELNFDGIEVSFNPRTRHLFTDSLNRAVWWAEETTILAHRAYCRGRLRYFDEATAPAKVGSAPSDVIFMG